MRYNIRGLEIRSENAAKPAHRAGAWILAWIRSLNKGYTGLDLGCGKLRYTAPLARAIVSVTAVDSTIQLDRRQTLFGVQTSVREHVATFLPNVRLCTIEDEHWKKDRFDVILCSNVLSAIPSRSVRKQVVSNAYQSLAGGGTFLLTTQFRNSHFTGWASNQRASRYCDGFLVRAKGGASFYGLLDAVALSEVCRSSGFSIIGAGHVNDLAYVLATRAVRLVPCRDPYKGR